MKELQSTVKRYLDQQIRFKRYLAVVVALSIVVSFAVPYVLTQPADSVTGKLICPLEAHIHTNACYLPGCEYAEQGEHTHTSMEAEGGCYELVCPNLAGHGHTEECLICTIPAYHYHGETCDYSQCAEDHVHNNSCCSIPEGHVHGVDCYSCHSEEWHNHSEACYEMTCTLAEHTHIDACYLAGELVCGKTLHEHSDECYAGNVVSSIVNNNEVTDVTLLVGLNNNDLINDYDGDGDIDTDDVIQNADEKFLLGIASQFCVFVAEDYRAIDSDAEGRVVVGGDMIINAGFKYNIGKGPYQQENVLEDEVNNLGFAYLILDGVVTGDGLNDEYNRTKESMINETLNYTHGLTANGEDVFRRFVLQSYGTEGYAFDSEKFAVPDDLIYGTQLLDIQAEYQKMISISEKVSGVRTLGAKTTVTERPDGYKTITFDYSGSAQNVFFHLEEGALDGVDEVIFNVPDNASVVINVPDEGTVDLGTDGTTIKAVYNGTEFSKIGADHETNNNQLSEKILYNFYNAHNINLNRNLNGTVLAPYALINGGSTARGEGDAAAGIPGNGHLSGALIARGFDGALEIGFRPYSGGIEIIETNNITVNKQWANTNVAGNVNVTLYQSHLSPDELGDVVTNSYDWWGNKTGQTLNSNLTKVETFYDAEGNSGTLQPIYGWWNQIIGYAATIQGSDGSTLTVNNPVSLNADMNWEYTWWNLPSADNNGNPLYYYLVEDFSQSYQTVYTGNGLQGGKVQVTNYQPIDLWVQKENHDYLGNMIENSSNTPSVKFKLYYSTMKPGDLNENETLPSDAVLYTATHEDGIYTISPQADQSWYNMQINIQNLPVVNDAGKLIYYYVEEIVPSGYEVSYENNGTNESSRWDNNNRFWTNLLKMTNTQKSLDLTIDKVWIGDKLDKDIEVEIYQYTDLPTLDELPLQLMVIGNTYLPVGGTTQLSIANGDENDVEYWSLDESILKVDANGLVTAKAAGTAKIAVRSNGQSAVHEITVKNAAEVAENGIYTITENMDATKYIRSITFWLDTVTERPEKFQPWIYLAKDPNALTDSEKIYQGEYLYYTMLDILGTGAITTISGEGNCFTITFPQPIAIPDNTYDLYVKSDYFKAYILHTEVEYSNTAMSRTMLAKLTRSVLKYRALAGVNAPYRTVKLNAANNWTITENLPAYQLDGNPYYYAVLEKLGPAESQQYTVTYAFLDSDGNYTTVIDGATAGKNPSVVITNKKDTKFTIRVNKAWADGNTEGNTAVTVALYQSYTQQLDGIPKDAVKVAGFDDITLRSSWGPNAWRGDFANLPVSDAIGTLYYYLKEVSYTKSDGTVVEVDSAESKYVPLYSNTAVTLTAEEISGGVKRKDTTITNQIPSLSAEKVWQPNPENGTTVTLQLYQSTIGPRLGYQVNVAGFDYGINRILLDDAQLRQDLGKLKIKSIKVTADEERLKDDAIHSVAILGQTLDFSSGSATYLYDTPTELLPETLTIDSTSSAAIEEIRFELEDDAYLTIVNSNVQTPPISLGFENPQANQEYRFPEEFLNQKLSAIMFEGNDALQYWVQIDFLYDGDPNGQMDYTSNKEVIGGKTYYTYTIQNCPSNLAGFVFRFNPESSVDQATFLFADSGALTKSGTDLKRILNLVYRMRAGLSSVVKLPIDDSVPEGAIAFGVPVVLDGTIDERETAKWTATWNDTPRYDGDGNPYYYYVVETSGPDDYRVSYQGNAASPTGKLSGASADITVKNQRDMDKVKLEIQKTWNDQNRTDAERPFPTFTVQYQSEGGAWVECPTNTYEINGPTKNGNVWTYEITGLNALDNNGNPSVYCIVENALEGYVVHYETQDVTVKQDNSGYTADPFKLTNTKTFNLTVMKEWLDHGDLLSHVGDEVFIKIFRSPTAPNNEHVPLYQPLTITPNGAQSTLVNGTLEFAVNKKVTVTIDDESVASYTMDGNLITVTGLKIGSAAMTVTDGEITHVIPITVDEFKLGIGKNSIVFDETTNLLPTVKDGVEYSVDSDGIVEIDEENHTIKGIGLGTVTITAKHNGVEASATVEVTPAVLNLWAKDNATSVVASNTLELFTNVEGATLTITSGSEYATLEGNVLTGIAEGTVVVTATKDNYTSPTITVQVVLPKISLWAKDHATTVMAMNTLELFTDVEGATLSIISGSDFATLEGNMLRGVAEGSVTIQATKPDYQSAELVITVTPNDQFFVQSSTGQKYMSGTEHHIEIVKGQTLQFTASKPYIDLNSWGGTGFTVNGTNGTTTLSITASESASGTLEVQFYNSGERMKFFVTAVDHPVISVTPTNSTLYLDESVTLSIQNATGTVHYSYSDGYADIIDFNPETGVVTPKAAGTATITVTDDYGSASATIVVMNGNRPPTATLGANSIIVGGTTTLTFNKDVDSSRISFGTPDIVSITGSGMSYTIQSLAVGQTTILVDGVEVGNITVTSADVFTPVVFPNQGSNFTINIDPSKTIASFSIVLWNNQNVADYYQVIARLYRGDAQDGESYLGAWFSGATQAVSTGDFNEKTGDRIVIQSNSSKEFGVSGYTITYTDGTSITKSIKNSMKVNLMKAADSSKVYYPVFDDNVSEVIKLSQAANQWQYLAGLPVYDESGNPYYYWIIEYTDETCSTEGSSANGYTVSYLFKDGDAVADNADFAINAANPGDKPTAIVYNTADETGGMTMPSTGGRGTSANTITGLALMLSSVAGFIVFKRRRNRRSA